MRSVWKNYGLGIVLFVLFLLSWLLQLYAGYKEHVLGDAVPYFWVALRTTMENWQSEFFQVLVFVVLSTYLIFKNSPQSRDGDDQMQQMVVEILRQIREMLGILKSILLRING